MEHQDKRQKKGILKVIQTVVLIAFVILAGLTVLSLLGVPKQLRIYVVETGSMTPAIPAGSLIFDVPAEKYKVGDIITFKADSESSDKSTNITHRISEVIEDDQIVTYQTKGDANQSPDSRLVIPRDIVGKVVFHIPYLGLVIGFAKTQIGFLVLIIIPTIIIIYQEFQNIKKELGKLRSRRKQNLNFTAPNV